MVTTKHAACQDAAVPVRFGIAGWSYPDWAGYLYPPGVRQPLAAIAPYVDLVEINSSFYRPPAPRHAEGWLAQTAAVAPVLRFSAKVHRAMTHDGRCDPALVDALRNGLAPLAGTGRLTHLLAQCSHAFDDTPDHRGRLERIRDALGDLAVLVVELRHDSWQTPAALGFLDGLGVTVANLDCPLGRRSFSLAECRVGADRYLRLHGRNAAAWFDPRAGRDATYTYLYSDAELREIARRAEALRRGARSLTVVANNHFQAREVTNILQLKALMTGRPVAVPPLLRTRYPALNAIAAAALP